MYVHVLSVSIAGMVGNLKYDFKNESALVTSSTSGIGRGIARSLAEADANVIVNSQTKENVEKLQKNLTNLARVTSLGWSRI